MAQISDKCFINISLIKLELINLLCPLEEFSKFFAKLLKCANWWKNPILMLTSQSGASKYLLCYATQERDNTMW